MSISIRKRVNLLESDGDILRSHIRVLEAKIALLEARIKMLERPARVVNTKKDSTPIIADSMHAQRFNNQQVVIEV